MRIAVIRGDELSEDWGDAWARAQAADEACESPFFHPEFMRATVAARGNVEIAVVEDNGAPLAFFPFERLRGGAARPVGGGLSDYQGVIGESSLGAGFDARDLLRACRLHAFDFDHLPVQQVRLASEVRRWVESPRIDLSGGFAEYVRAKRDGRSQLFHRAHYLERRLEREFGPVRFLAREVDATAFRKLVDWKSAQYRRTGCPDIFRSNATRAIIERLRETRTDGFEGIVSALYAGDRMISAHFGLRSRSCWHYWFPAHDVEFAKFSPGLILVLKMAQAAQRLGVDTIDLGAGDQAYKQRLANGARWLAAGSLQLSGARAHMRRWRREVAALAHRTPFTRAGLAILRGLRPLEV